MNKAEFTERPWKAKYLFKRGAKKTITVRDLGGYTLAVIPRDRPQPEQEANSLLIESAPDLYGALTAALIHLEAVNYALGRTGCELEKWGNVPQAIPASEIAAIREVLDRATRGMSTRKFNRAAEKMEREAVELFERSAGL